MTFHFSEAQLAQAQAQTENRYLHQPDLGMNLLMQLMRRPEATHAQHTLQALKVSIDNDYVQLSNQDHYPNKAQVFKDLLALQNALEYLAYFPHLAHKQIVGVGGGFSAGKSRFLNSLIGQRLLPEALEPTTAIASFITAGEQESIQALNQFYALVPLDHDALQAISHDFQRQYKKLGSDVGFAHILRLLMLELPDFKWQNIAFLDTPGYSKADAEQAFNINDNQLALSQLKEADAIIWLINAKNGTIRQEDIAFIHALDHSKPIFFVLTQADLVNQSSIHSLLDTAKHSIEQAGITIAGMMAWTAHSLTEKTGQHLAGDDIFSWLNHLDQQPKYTDKRRLAEQAIDKHIAYNSQLINDTRHLLTRCNKILIDEDIHKPELENELEFVVQQLTFFKQQQLAFVDIEKKWVVYKDKLLSLVVQLVGNRALDAPVRSKQECLISVPKEKHAFSIGEQRLVSIMQVMSDIKRVRVKVTTAWFIDLPFSKVRHDWQIDPTALTANLNLLLTFVSEDKQQVTLALSRPDTLASE